MHDDFFVIIIVSFQVLNAPGYKKRHVNNTFMQIVTFYKSLMLKYMYNLLVLFTYLNYSVLNKDYLIKDNA